ncbi:hypothetical protein Taro_018008 [Colocasia esculenta]|uniref:Peroxidase n=1 Tax=Colocasia esculenta TaxID=4460 RepID=A0A843UHP2_COLES|nr:hypothetical protein [Colocasia esculenta]
MLTTRGTRGLQLLMLLLLLVALLLQGAVTVVGALKAGFYDKTCPGAEAMVQKVVNDAFDKDYTVAPGLLRLFFHDCFVRGCDASVLIDSTAGNHAEKDADHNKALHGFEVVDAAKADIEAACPGVVSCADILAFAARESVALAGNFFYAVPGGRRDGVISREVEVEFNLPASNFNAAQLIERFVAKNLTADDLVTLTGGHSLGVAHCTAITDRLYAYSRTSDTDPTLGPAYAALLRKSCPVNHTTAAVAATNSSAVWLDLLTPEKLDNQFYATVQMGFAVLGSDQALMADPDLKAAVAAYASDAKLWVAKFSRAMVKLGNMVELTEEEGEIRMQCRVVNGGNNRLVASN